MTRALHDSLRRSLPGDLLGALQQSVVDIFSTGDLRLDHAQVLGVRHGLRLHRVRLGGGWNQVGRMLGAVDALGEALVSQPLNGGRQRRGFALYIQSADTGWWAVLEKASKSLNQYVDCGTEQLDSDYIV